MKFFVTGVNGQLGHDVMNELNKRGQEGYCRGEAGCGQPVSEGSTAVRGDKENGTDNC